MTMDIMIICWAKAYVENSINGHWFITFCSIKGKIPTFAASVAFVDTKIATIEDSQRGVVVFLVKNTILSKLGKSILFKYRDFLNEFDN